MVFGMRLDLMELDAQDAIQYPPLPPLSRLDKDGVLLAMSGGSVVDWAGLSFKSYEDVDNFLRLWHCDINKHTWARERLQYVYNQAINYLEEQLGVTFPPHIHRPADVRDVFLGASARGRFVRNRIQYCAVLKLMHVINHLEMQELRSNCPIREVDLLEHANLVVLRAAEELRATGFPLRAFYGNRKTRPSVITKLLAKREATAAPIFDKLRFRIVTEERSHIIPAIAWLLKNLVPFPAIIPGESHNSLISKEELIQATEANTEVNSILTRGLDALSAPTNRHSGASYRVVNFVADLPLRVYDLPGLEAPRHRAVLGEAVSVLVEFQILDAATDFQNEQGDSRHSRYKERQMEVVRSRLGRAFGKGM
jgi:uncharacterized protein (TIGR04552 family)